MQIAKFARGTPMRFELFWNGCNLRMHAHVELQASLRYS